MMEVAFFYRTTLFVTLYRNDFRNLKKTSVCCTDPETLQITISFGDLLDQQVCSPEHLLHSMEQLKDLLLTSWHQISEDTFWCLVESIPNWVRTVLHSHARPTSYQASFGLCVCIYISTLELVSIGRPGLVWGNVALEKSTPMVECFLNFVPSLISIQAQE